MWAKINKCLAKTWWQVALIVLLALVLRLYKIGEPIADWHSFRQADTISVAYEYYRAMRFTPRSPGSSFPCGSSCLDLRRPQYQDLSNIQSGEDNLAGWRMVEMPLISGLVASILYVLTLFNLASGEPIELIYRSVDILLSLLSVMGIYLLVRKVTGRKLTAVLGSLLLAILPYSVFYSRTVLPEVPLITGQIWGLYFLTLFLDAKNRKGKIVYWLATALTLVITLLIKPVAVFILPVVIFLIWQKYQLKLFKHFELYILAIIIVVPLIWWREWILQFPSGIPASDWLLQGSVKMLSLTWWRWLFVERLIKLIVGLVGAILVLGSVLIRGNNFVRFYLLGSLLFLMVFASGNVQHDYYQNMILPSVVMALASSLTLIVDVLRQKKITKKIVATSLSLAVAVQVGFYLLTNNFNEINLGQTIGWQLIVLIVLVMILLLVWWQFWRKKTALLGVFLMASFILGLAPLSIKILDFYHVNNWAMVRAGEAARELLPPKSEVIAPYQGDTTFLWQTRYRGWPIGFEIEDKIAKGAQYYVTVNFDDEAKELEQKYQTVVKTDEYLILDLTNSVATESAKL